MVIPVWHDDQVLTQAIKNWGQNRLVFWRQMAGNGMWLYLFVGVPAVVIYLMPWWHLVLPLMVSYTLALLFQNILGRNRPVIDKKAHYKMWFRTYSCPSGHATTSAAWAASLAVLFPYPSLAMQIIVIAFLIALTIAVGVSRIVVGVHYVIDVLLGFALGTIFGIGYALVFLYV